MSANPGADDWHVRLFKPGPGWPAQPVRPAEVGVDLCDVMLARENLLEDVEYRKIVPNQFIVELPSENLPWLST